MYSISTISKRLNFQLENPSYQDDDDEEEQGETNEITEIISFTTFMKQHCKQREVREIVLEHDTAVSCI